MKIIKLQEINSTNEYAKKFIESGEDTVIIAESQTDGKGSKGRSFLSGKGGIYLTYLRFGKGEKAKDGFLISVNVTMAIVKTLKAFGIDAKIKWPNDIIVNGKKICGILIENTFSGEYISHSVIGVGLNVNNTLDDEIKDIAISVSQIKSVDFDSLLATLIFNLERPSSLEEYKKYSAVIGNYVYIVGNSDCCYDKVEDVGDSGELIISGGKKLYCNEVKIKTPNEKLKKVYEYINKNCFENCNLRRYVEDYENAKILYAKDDGVCLLNEEGLVALTCDNSSVAEKAISKLKDESGYFTVMCRRKSDYLACEKLLDLKWWHCCYQVEYNSKTEQPTKQDLIMKKLDLSYAPFVAETYLRDKNVEHAKYQMSHYGLWGGFIGKELAGYIGYHEEGALGFLQVMPKFKRQGIATSLINYLINDCRKQGKTAYCHIMVDNEISQKMHKTLDCKISNEIMYWCGTKEKDNGL